MSPVFPSSCPFTPQRPQAIGYFRFHGRNTSWFNVPTSVRYDYLYSTAQIKEFITPITFVASKTEKVFAFFNNCRAGSAVRNAAMLIRMIQEKEQL